MIKISIITSLYRCDTYLESYLQYVVNTEGHQDTEFLLLHNDPLDTELACIDRYKDRIPHLRHIIIKVRESLYTTWNRGIRLSEGEYIAIWNVDDIRLPNSIQNQAKALDDNPDAAISYGDVFISTEYGKRTSELYRHPQWEGNKKEFCRSYIMSCFQMWRRSLHADLGYYDEQFYCVGDFDFQIRVAMQHRFVKVEEPLGIFLVGTVQNISSTPRQAVENNMIYYRYGVYEKIQLHLLWKSMMNYRINKWLFFGRWKSNEIVSPFTVFERIKGVIICVLKLPFFILRSIRRDSIFKRQLIPKAS